MDKTILNNTTPPGEYFYFRCPQGHENYLCLSENKGYERLEEEKVIVYCQKCDWKSHPFQPVLFQHHAGGDLLLWVYTTKEANSINSVWNVSFDSLPQNITYPEKVFVPEAAKKEEKDSISIPYNETRQEKTPLNIAETVEIPVKKELPPMSSQKEKTVAITKQEASRSLEDTIEIARPKPKETMEFSENDHRYYHYFPKDLPPFKMPQPYFIPIFQTMLFLLAFLLIGFLGLKSCNEKGTEIAQAIKNIQIQTGAYNPMPQKITPDNKESNLLASQYETLKQQYQEVQKTLEDQSQANKTLEEKYKTLEKNYEKQELEKKELLTKTQTLSPSQQNQEYQKALKNYKDILSSLQKEFDMEELSSLDKDYLQPCLSIDNSFLLYLQETSESTGNLCHALKIGWPWNKEKKETEIFKTPSLKAQQENIPFFYSWDGKENAALLTRIDGESSIHYVLFSKKENSMKALESKKIFSVSHPDILGTPKMSAHGKYIAFMHKDKTDIWVKVYSVKDGVFRLQTMGGADTSRVPEWSNDNKKLYFLTNNRKGIVEWSLPKEKRIQPFSREIYGCYLSCSPDGKYLAFFQESEEGKGLVHLTLWDILSNQIRILQSNILTVETCRPAWSPQGRFLAVIHSGTQDQIMVYDTLSDMRFPVLEKTGRIKWIDWSNTDAITFSYKEGLFTRPYLVRLVSWFTKH